MRNTWAIIKQYVFFEHFRCNTAGRNFFPQYQP